MGLWVEKNWFLSRIIFVYRELLLWVLMRFLKSVSVKALLCQINIGHYKFSTFIIIRNQIITPYAY